MPYGYPNIAHLARGLRRDDTVYFVGRPSTEKFFKSQPVKIGYSSNPRKRLRQLQTAAPMPLTFLYEIHGNTALEAEIHRRLKADGAHLHGEWFSLCHDDIMGITWELAEDGYPL